jgi:RNA polymerase sigma factor (sigma-70 family)
MDPESLWREHRGLAKSLAARRCRQLKGAWLFDDLVQAGEIALYEMARKWSPGYGVQFTSFAYKHVRGEVLRESWKLQAWGFNGGRAEANGRCGCLPSQIGKAFGARDEDEHPLEHPVDAEELRDLAEVLLGKIRSATEKEVCRRYFLLGESTKDIAEGMSLSVERVKQARPAGVRDMYKSALDMGLLDE